MIAKNWAKDAAAEIAGYSWAAMTDDERSQLIANLQQVIQKHCPFKPDTLYEEVGIAQEIINQLKTGDCWCEVGSGNPMYTVHSKPCLRAAAFVDGVLPPREPLLECIQCHNTESPAGALARYHNFGRCMHCGNYFKVVRA